MSLEHRPPQPPVPAGLGGWLATGLSILRRSAAPLLVLAAVAAAADAVDKAVALNGGIDWITQSFSLAAVVVRTLTYSAALVVVIRFGSGGAVSVLGGLRVAVRRILPLLGWLVVGLAMTVLGLLLLVLPGLYVLIVLGATLIAVVTLEERGIRRCFELVRCRFWPTVVRVVLILAPAGTWWYGTDAISFRLVAQPAAAVLVYAVLAAPAYAFVAAFLAATYTELTAHDDQRASGAHALDDPATLPAPVPRVSTLSLPSRVGATTVDEAEPAGPGERRDRTPMLIAVTAGGLVLVVLTAFATIGVIHAVGASPASDQATAPSPPATRAGSPAAPSTAADVLGPVLAQARRDGSGTFTLTTTDRLPWPGTTGTFAYRGDAVSLHAMNGDPDFYVRSTVVIDGERFLGFVFNPGEEGSWSTCSSIEEDPCRYTAYMQDFADPLQLLVRAGPAAQLVTSTPDTIDGGRVAIRYEFEFGPERAVANELDPLWQARFGNSWLQTGTIYLWVDDRFRLLQMNIGNSPYWGEKVTYADWGSGDPIPLPAAG